MTIDAGAIATDSIAVTLGLSWSKQVAEARLRNEGSGWGDWTSVAASVSFSLTPGEGEKTVEAQFRDAWGTTSEGATDTILLDQTRPTGTVTIAGGGDWVGFPDVPLELVYADLESGVTDVRLRNGASSWSPWQTASHSVSWSLSPGDGLKTVGAQFRDLAGNVSEVEDWITLDETGPEVESVVVNEGRPYVLAHEKLLFVVRAADGTAGSGIADFAASFDGSTWTAWYPLLDETPVEVPRPEAEGLLTATVVVRDRLGNGSAPFGVPVYLVERDVPSLGAGAKFAGNISAASDVDAVALHLVKGDVLTVKAKVKKRTVLLALDLVGPGGERRVLGRFPADASKPVIQGYPVPETGLHHLVARREGGTVAGSYKLTAKVKQAKGNKKGKGEWTGTEIPFEAAHGSTLKATLSAEGLTAAAISLLGPEGELPFEAKEGKGKVTILPVSLDAGTGAYAIRFAEAVTVNAKWSLKLPKVKGTVGE